MKFVAACRYIYTFSKSDSSLSKGSQIHLREITVDIIFVVCSIGGFAATALIGMTLLLVAMDKIEV